jgi:hypothetical protein
MKNNNGMKKIIRFEWEKIFTFYDLDPLLKLKGSQRDVVYLG